MEKPPTHKNFRLSNKITVGSRQILFGESLYSNTLNMNRSLYMLAFLVPIFLQGQETFNKRMRFDFPAAVITSIIPTDSFYYATSIIADSVFPYSTGNAFLKFDMYGELIDIKTIRNTEKTYETWNDNFLHLPNGGFAVQGYSIDSTMNSILIRYDGDGDTIYTKSFPSPYSPNFLFIQPSGGLVQCQDGGFLLANTAQSSSTSNENYLIKTDSLGNIEWDKVYHNGDWDRPQSLLATPDGKFIVGAMQTNQNITNSNYTFQCHIFQVDSIGNVEWDYKSPISSGLRDAANDMVLLDDGSLVVASGVGYEQESSSVNAVYFEKMVFKLSPDRELEWEVKFSEKDTTSWSRTSKIIKLTDGSGFIVGGMAYEALPFPKYFAVRGWLAKISNEGDIIWTRQHVYLDDGEDEHKIFDMREASDGGLIVCGEAKEWESGALYRQQAWLLKLDGHGCLIPGCHLLDDVDENVVSPLQLAIYPNPTSDYLNFQLQNDQPIKGSQFRIVDMDGSVVRSFQVDTQTNDLYITPVWNWAEGMYLLQFLGGDGNMVISEKFIVSH